MLCVRVRAEAVLAQPLQRLPVTGRREALAVTETVDPDRERPRGGDRRVLLAQRSRRSVAWVRSRLLALRDQALVELVEAAEREIHLAAHLEERRRRLTGGELHPHRDWLARPQGERELLGPRAVR